MAQVYQYDAAGNTSFVVNRKGRVSGFAYDALNRRIGAGFGATSSVSPVYASTVLSTWDAANRLTNIVDSRAGTLSRSYDAAGQRQSLSPSGGTPLG